MHISHYYLQQFFNDNTITAFNFSQLIIFLQEFLTLCSLEGQNSKNKTNLSHIGVEIQLIQHGFSSPALLE